MKRTRLIDMLRILTSRERTKFKEYVFSPYFNKNKKVQLLCAHILKYAPAYTHVELDKKSVYRKIYQSDSYNELQINNIISDLLQLLYNFLAQNQYQHHPPLEKQLLLKDLLTRDQLQHFDKNVKRYRQILSKSTYRSYEYFLDEYHLNDQLDSFFLTKAKREYDEHLQLKSDYLDQYYFTNKLRIACDMASRNIVINAGYTCQFLEEIKKDYNNHQELSKQPSIQVYYKTLEMLNNSDEEVHYYSLKKLLQQNISLFPQEELRVLYDYILNHCIKEINSGKLNYYKEILEVYEVLLEQEIILKNGYLTQWDFKNIVTVGLRIQDFEWVEQFIFSYQSKLLQEEQPNALAYNLAALYYEKKLYSKALQQLHNVEFTDTSYHLGAKIIQLKSYYELDETEAFYALLEAFSKYVLRNKQLSDYRKKANNNFLKIAKKIYQLKIRQNTLSRSNYQQKKSILKTTFQEISPIANKDWLNLVFNQL